MIISLTVGVPIISCEYFDLAANGETRITLYTDSQNIINLPARRTRLEAKNYMSSQGKRLNNYELYEAFYYLSDELSFELIKVTGHLASEKKHKIDRLFGLVDKASRRALRANR